jgi:hypothetical protein
MGSARQNMPQKQPIPILDEWKRRIESSRLHSRLSLLEELVNGGDLKWDQQMAILRKLGNINRMLVLEG